MALVVQGTASPSLELSPQPIVMTWIPHRRVFRPRAIFGRSIRMTWFFGAQLPSFLWCYYPSFSQGPVFPQLVHPTLLSHQQLPEPALPAPVLGCSSRADVNLGCEESF